MAEKVDQDVREAAAKLVPIFNQPKGWQERASLAILTGKWDNVQLLTTLARMKAAGRQQGLREAAAIFTEAAEATRQDADNGLWGGIEDEVGDAISIFNGHAARITALIEGEGK